jgi:superfamily II helicase
VNMCRKCGKNKATIPDRNSMSRRARICSECHRESIKSDLKILVDQHKGRMVNYGNQEHQSGCEPVDICK